MSSEPILKRTPLYGEHTRLGAKITGFGGWEMPVQYSGIIDEHQAVRAAVGVFDISHMGQFLAGGSGAKEWLNHLLANNVERLDVGHCQYTFLLNDKGGVIDDLIIYRYGEEEYLLVVNAALIEEDFTWMQAHLREGVNFENRSENFAGLAVQGPQARKVFEAFFGQNRSIPAHNEISGIEIDDAHFFVARTGYTGEDGFEMFFPAAQAVKVWNEILEKGRPHGIKPCGLGARDTLRLEMCYPLNGSDLSPERTPLEAGLSIFVDLEKTGFIGREALVKQRAEGVAHRLVPFKMKDKCPPPRAHYPVHKNGVKIAEITSGSLSPSLNIGIGMAYIPATCARINEEIEVGIRGQFFPATIQKKPLYKKIMSNIPQDLKYAETHEWLRVEGETATVGISDHAQAELTDIVYVELPAVGAQTEAGKAVAVVESVKAASDIYSPVSGTITAANTALASNPALVNTDPYGEGWLFKLKIANPAEIAALKTPEAYLTQVG